MKSTWKTLQSILLASLGALAVSGGNANAKWIKVTIAGTFTSGPDNGISFNNWSFTILPYSLTSTTPGPGGTGSVQTQPFYGIGYSPPLVGFSSFTGTGFSGQYNSWGQPMGSDYLSFTNASPSVIKFKTGRQPTIGGESTTGITYTSQLNVNDQYDVVSIELTGGMTSTPSGFNPGDPTSSDGTITGLISGALTLTNPSPQTVNCASSCDSGKLNVLNEDPFGFTWSSITFESIEGVPAPVPISGGVYFFYFSRRLRARTKAAK